MRGLKVYVTGLLDEYRQAQNNGSITRTTSAGASQLHWQAPPVAHLRLDVCRC